MKKEMSAVDWWKGIDALEAAHRKKKIAQPEKKRFSAKYSWGNWFVHDALTQSMLCFCASEKKALFIVNTLNKAEA